MTEQPINERAQHLLKVLVERYIRDGQPVGSRVLARESGMDLSPATIRNVMADLEDMGLVKAPHTSAGRVPTARGYRLFIDSLLTVRPLEVEAIRQLEDQLDPDMDLQGLLERAALMLSGVTHMAGLVMLPRREHVILRHVEFLPLSQSRVLVILVVNEKEVQNRIIHTGRSYTAAQLQEAANFLNESYAGRDMVAVRARLVEDMREHRDSIGRMMDAVLEMASQAFETEPPPDDYVVSGTANLLRPAEGQDLDRLRQLMDAFGRKRDILYLLDQCLGASGVQIFIGEESGYEVLDGFSAVTAPYSVAGEVMGVLGVIGPTRMAYGRVIPTVDVTARLLRAALNPNP